MTIENPDEEPEKRPGATSDAKPVDQRGKLAEEPFDVQITRDKVLVRFRKRLVRILTGADADEIRDVAASGDMAALQLLVARKTGNFKRGNER